MSRNTLAPELVALIHHVELTKYGWWDKAVEQLITTALWTAQSPLGIPEITERLKTGFGISLDQQRVQRRVESMCGSSVLHVLPNGTIKISEKSSAEMEAARKKAEENDTEAKLAFVSLITSCCGKLDPELTWREFNDGLITPLTLKMGARTYELLTGESPDYDAIRQFSAYLEKYPVELREGVRKSVIGFLDPAHLSTRSYVLRRLSASLYVQAGGLSDETLSALATIPTTATSFTLFVDTNFLFSVLGLHENPSNEAALLLFGLLRHLSGSVTVKLYVVPPTVSEMKKVLLACQSSLQGLRLLPNLADVARDSHLSGIVRKYFDEVRVSRRMIAPEAYFAPYFDNLVDMLRPKGVELYNEDMSRMKADPDVMDDINASLAFYAERGGKSKTYEQLEHDVMLWHFVRRKRPSLVESPLGAKFWVVTVDYRFLAYDRQKLRSSGDSVPVCLDPATLIQMLQFWVPRTPQFEEAVLGTMRLPFLFSDFNEAAERMTVKILGVISRYENAGDLPRETVAAVTWNEGLRSRLRTESDASKQVELVREVLIDENRRALKLVEAERKEKEIAKAAAVAQEKAAEQRIGELEVQVTRERKESLDIGRKFSDEAARRQSLESRVAGLEAAASQREKLHSDQLARRSFFLWWVVLPAFVAMAVGTLLTLVAGSVPRLSVWQSYVVVWLTMVLALMLTISLVGRRRPQIASWPSYMIYHRFWKWVTAAIWLVILGAVGSALKEGVASLWQQLFH